MRRGELITITAGSGVGKTQICREIAYHLLNEGQTLGYIALEESTKRTALGLMGLDATIPLHIDKQGIDENALKSAFDNTVGSGRVYLTTISVLLTTSSTKSDTLQRLWCWLGCPRPPQHCCFWR